MKTTELKYFSERAVKYKSTVELAKFLSVDVWNRIEYTINARSNGSVLRLFETTITQNLVYEIHKFMALHNLSIIHVEEAIDEKRNGNDIEFLIRFDNGYLVFPIQAKLLKPYANFKDGVYSEFNHKNENGLQINLLKKYAEEVKSHLSFYLFYNCLKDLGQKYEVDYLYGCSFISIDELEKIKFTYKNPIFSELHFDSGKPFYHLFEIDQSPTFRKGNGPKLPRGPQPKDPNDDVKNFYKKYGKTIDDSFITNKLKFWSKEEITDNNVWKKLDTDRVVSNADVDYHSDGFNPKYRVSFSINEKKLLHEESILVDLGSGVKNLLKVDKSEDKFEFEH